MSRREAFHAIYDNPSTAAREAWVNGNLIGHTQAVVLLGANWRGHRSWSFIFNVGEWEPGRLWGDPRAFLPRL